MAKLQSLIGVAFLTICVAGCAAFRHDSAGFGGYYLTSLVEHVGHRLLTVEKIYLTDNFVIAEARLTRPTRLEQTEFVGTRFLVATREHVDIQVRQEFERQKRNQLYIPVGPFASSDLKQHGPKPLGWVLWPGTLGELDKDPTIEDVQRILQCNGVIKYSASKVPYRIENNEYTASFSYPHYVDTSSFWQEHEYLVYRPIPTTVFKSLVVPPAMVIDTASLPVVGIIYFAALLNYAHGHIGP